MTFASFGCAPDVLDAPDKLALKLAYLDALRKGLVGGDIARDPYDLLETALEGTAGLVTVGKLELEPWMTPRPALDAGNQVDVMLYREFLDTGGCAIVSARLREFVRDRVLPLTPFMIGVDHSLTGGVLDAICGPDPEEMALLIMDSHFDAIPSQVRRAAATEAGDDGAASEAEPEPESYNCGTWVAGVIERELVAPSNIVVLGASDRPPDAGGAEDEGMAAFRDAYSSFEERGVRVITKQRIREIGPAEAAREALDGLRAKSIYVSLDADTGAGEQVKAVRFLDTIGLEPAAVGRFCRSKGPFRAPIPPIARPAKRLSGAAARSAARPHIALPGLTLSGNHNGRRRAAHQPPRFPATSPPPDAQPTPRPTRTRVI